MPNKHACVINEKFYEFTLSDKKPALHISLSVNYNNEKKIKLEQNYPKSNAIVRNRTESFAVQMVCSRLAYGLFCL